MVNLTKAQVRRHWLKAQGLDQKHPFGRGPRAALKAIEHLGYVQIDTISVIERSHHHILFSRIPDYKKSHLHQAQTIDKTVFEYWTHALAYVPSKDFRYFMRDMKERRTSTNSYFGTVTKEDMQKVLRLIKKEGPISIRDIDDDVLVDKNHPWASRKPSKKALQWGFNCGDLVISERLGMLKKYELTERHFGWEKKPKAATALEVLDYRLDTGLRAQGVVSVESLSHLEKVPFKTALKKRIEGRVRKGSLLQVAVEGNAKTQFWCEPELLDLKPKQDEDLVHILSPFDPLVVQRKRFHEFFGHDHRFEAYLPKEKRKYGYFTLPVLIGEEAVAVLDLKTDRQKQKLLIQQWSWLEKHKSMRNKKLIEQELARFEEFQLEK